MDFLTILPRSTIRIEAGDGKGGLSQGTGFLYRFSDRTEVESWVITNKHVIHGMNTIALTLSVADPKSGKDLSVATLTDDKPHIIVHPDPNVDLAAIWFPPFVGQTVNMGAIPKQTILERSNIISQDFIDSITAIEPILMIGYPRGIYDKVNNNPIVRQGITATPYWDDFEGRKEFVIDCATFRGSSGSPIFIYRDSTWYDRASGQMKIGERPIALAGILYAGPIFKQSGEIVSPNPENLAQSRVSMDSMMNIGYCIKASEIEVMRSRAKAHVKWARDLIIKDLGAENLPSILQDPIE